MAVIGMGFILLVGHRLLPDRESLSKAAAPDQSRHVHDRNCWEPHDSPIINQTNCRRQNSMARAGLQVTEDLSRRPRSCPPRSTPPVEGWRPPWCCTPTCHDFNGKLRSKWTADVQTTNRRPTSRTISTRDVVCTKPWSGRNSTLTATGRCATSNLDRRLRACTYWPFTGTTRNIQDNLDDCQLTVRDVMLVEGSQRRISKFAKRRPDQPGTPCRSAPYRAQQGAIAIAGRTRGDGI